MTTTGYQLPRRWRSCDRCGVPHRPRRLGNILCDNCRAYAAIGAAYEQIAAAVGRVRARGCSPGNGSMLRRKLAHRGLTP
jgi:hypothetical protein